MSIQPSVNGNPLGQNARISLASNATFDDIPEPLMDILTKLMPTLDRNSKDYSCTIGDELVSKDAKIKNLLKNGEVIKFNIYCNTNIKTTLVIDKKNKGYFPIAVTPETTYGQLLRIIVTEIIAKNLFDSKFYEVEFSKSEILLKRIRQDPDTLVLKSLKSIDPSNYSSSMTVNINTKSRGLWTWMTSFLPVVQYQSENENSDE